MLKRLEDARWPMGPVCPYCHAIRSTPLAGECRHHCNYCNTSFSVLTRTPLHGTRLELRQWLHVAELILFHDGAGVTSRQIATIVGVNRNTACRMIRIIHISRHEQPSFLSALGSLIQEDGHYV